MGENRDDDLLELSLRLGSNPSNMITSSKNVHDHRNPIWDRPVLQSQDGNSPRAEKFSHQGVDMNWTPLLVEWAEGGGDNGSGGGPQLSPNSTVSSLSGKRSEREVAKALNSPGSCSEDNQGGAASEEEETASAKKKLRLSKGQAGVLEDNFKQHSTLNPKQKITLAKELKLSPRQVEVWFQNRRARTKLKQVEVDCQYLKRCCENLTEENKRLQKELQELRALKRSPHLCTHIPPTTTIAMCPSCDRARATSAPPSASAAAVTIATTNDRCNRLLVGQGYTRSTPIRSSWGPINLHSHDGHGL